MLLAAGADPCAAADNGWTPLHQAAEGLHARAVYDWMNWEAWHPFKEASPAGLIIKALLAAGTQLDAEAPGWGSITPAEVF